ncbi:MAG: hypothetical protein CBC15_04250 [Candidatus Endolissoclinum sp. TMED55]|nr:MAG: hypothetical protein CBC15_04250 [Candidatus Endolissoclinum sp. TMED55]
MNHGVLRRTLSASREPGHAAAWISFRTVRLKQCAGKDSASREPCTRGLASERDLRAGIVTEMTGRGKSHPGCALVQRWQRLITLCAALVAKRSRLDGPTGPIALGTHISGV